MRHVKVLSDLSKTKHHAVVTRTYSEFVVHGTRMPNKVGELAIKIAERLAICTAQPSGKCDESGRMIYEVMHPETVAQRALDIAEHLMLKLEKADMFIELPIAEEYNKIPINGKDGDE